MHREHRGSACRPKGRYLAVTILLGATIACAAVAYPDPVPVETEYDVEQLLPALLVGISHAQAMVDQHLAIGPCFGTACLDYTDRWVMLADVAVRGAACMPTAGSDSLADLKDNLQATLERGGDLAAELLGPLPLLIEVQYRDSIDYSLHTRGWLHLDAAALRSAQIPDLCEADSSTEALSDYSSALARRIGIAMNTGSWAWECSWQNGYLPGIGVFVNVFLDRYPANVTSSYPENLNTVSEWVDALSRMLAELDPEPLAALGDEESLIVTVRQLPAAFHFEGVPVYFVIGKDVLAGPHSWRIYYRP